MKRAEYTAIKYWHNFKSAVFYIFIGMIVANTRFGSKLIQVANKSPEVIAEAHASDIETKTYNVTVPTMPQMDNTIGCALTPAPKSTGTLKEPKHG